MSRTRVLMAMSGGVDSSVAAALLYEAGYDVIGISMLLAGSTEGKDGSCCSLDDFQDARRVAEQLDIPYYVLNLKRSFANRSSMSLPRNTCAGAPLIPACCATVT
jgi:tRNA-specific 2-thiouridylase